MSELREDTARFETTGQLRYDASLVGTPFEGLNRFRTFGAHGPLYEVMAVKGDKLRIWLFNSSDETEYGIDHAIEDPVAE